MHSLGHVWTLHGHRRNRVCMHVARWRLHWKSSTISHPKWRTQNIIVESKVQGHPLSTMSILSRCFPKSAPSILLSFLHTWEVALSCNPAEGLWGSMSLQFEQTSCLETGQVRHKTKEGLFIHRCTSLGRWRMLWPIPLQRLSTGMV